MLSKVRALTADEVTIILDTLDAALDIKPVISAADGGNRIGDSHIYNVARRRGLKEAQHIVLAICEPAAEVGNND